MDVTSNENEARVGMMLVSPEGHKIHCTIRFRFQELNNVAKNKALITSLHLEKKL